MTQVPMRSIHKILLPTDFSNGAETATELAIEMAKKFGASLLLLHVYSAPIFIGAFGDVYALSPNVVDKLQDDAERALAQLSRRATEAGVTVDTLAIEGIAADAILAVTRSRSIDLIVMGTHGRTGLQHFLLGSVAERVVRTSECPVLTVRGAKHAQCEPETRSGG